MKRPRLSDAQWRILGELSEPNQNSDGAWYFPHRNGRTLESLAVLGYARHTESDMQRVGYTITAEGRERLKDGLQPMAPLRLHWHRDSHRRYSAKIGPLRATVKRCGIVNRGQRTFWIVESVCGSRPLSETTREFARAEDAMEHAEIYVARMLVLAELAWAGLEPGDGLVSHD